MIRRCRLETEQATTGQHTGMEFPHSHANLCMQTELQVGSDIHGAAVRVGQQHHALTPEVLLKSQRNVLPSIPGGGGPHLSRLI